MKKIAFYLSAMAMILLSQSFTNAQPWLPPGGDNQFCSITQRMGMVEITVTYSSPDVTSPQGVNRQGKIWGELVPYGFADMNGNKIPWRAGANENTTISFSQDVQVEGRDIPAGKYGLFMVPDEETWTIILSKDNNKWGAFFYNEANDALRVEVKPVSNQYTEWLTYDFITKELSKSVLTMKWENLMVPIDISVEDAHERYVAEIKEKLSTGEIPFNADNLMQAASFCVANDVALEQGLEWADAATRPPFSGRFSFRTFAVQSVLLAKLDREEESSKAWERAMGLIANDPKAILFEGWYLLGVDAEAAMRVFELNVERFPEDVFTTNEGLARGYTALGEKRKAIKHWEVAIANVPEADKQYLPFYEQALKQLKEEVN